jgi:CubicO group peptidase (beta-lactamase class C family)
MYMAAGRAAARRGGQPWEKLVKERIAEPLGMKNLRFTTTAIAADADRATGHQRGSKTVVMPDYPMREPNPAGSIHASARDLSQWIKFHLAGGVGGGKRLVSEKNLKETQRPQNIIRLQGNARAMNPDTFQLSYGLGWVVSDHRGQRVIAHGGQIDGIRVQITLLPDAKLGFALLNNLHETRMNQAVTNTLIDLYCGLSPRDWNGFFLKIEADAAAARKAAIEARDKARNPDTRPSLPLAAYSGEYTHEAYGKLKAIEKDGRLSIQWHNFTCPLEHFQDNVFRVTEGYFEEKLVGFGGMAGRVMAVQFNGIVFKR